LSRTEASGKVSLPLPQSARDIYYLEHSSGMQEYELFVRFSVDPSELDKAVNDILVDHDRTMQRKPSSYPKISIAAAPQTPEFRRFLPMTWWAPNAITNGYYRGENGATVFHVWTDTDHDTIFVCATD
jgi:hypothetical protein